MLQINQLLERFKNLTNNDKTKKQQIVDILMSNNIPVDIKQISFIKNTVYIKTKPIIKTEILMKKELILNQIKKNHSISNISSLQ